MHTPCTCCCRRDCRKASTVAAQAGAADPDAAAWRPDDDRRCGEAPARPDPVLIRALRAAHAMLARDAIGGPVLEAIPASPYHRRLLRLAFLAPELQRAILTGRSRRALAQAPPRQRLPLLWSEQVRVFGAVEQRKLGSNSLWGLTH